MTFGSARSRAQLRVMAIVVGLACILGPAFNILTDEVSWDAVAQGLVDSLLVSTGLGGYVIFVRDGLWRNWLRRRSFVANLVINATMLMLLFLTMRGLGQVATSGHWHRFFDSLGDAHLGYALPFGAAMAFAFQFVLQMNRMIGTNVLGYFLTGAYHRPVEEERIFLFLDLESSSKIAERLGSATYYEMLRRFVDDLSDPILESEGEIYQYVGDEVVITWRREAGLRRANCILCFFRIVDAIAANASLYQRQFGIVPTFRGGLHGGTVTGGELGELRQQIVFVGDILNTASRLEDYARQHSRRFVASGDVIEQIVLPGEVVAENLGEFQPRGKQSTVAVYALARTGDAPVRSTPLNAAG